MLGLAESRESRASYARRHGVSVGSLMRWAAQAEVAKAESRGMQFVEVEVPARPDAGRQGPKERAWWLRNSYCLEGRAFGSLAGREHADFHPEPTGVFGGGTL